MPDQKPSSADRRALLKALYSNWQAEMEGLRTYSTLAERESDPVRRKTLEHLAHAEDVHAQLWEKRILELGETDMRELLEKMRALGPKIALITDGPKGSYAYDGDTMLKVPMYPDPKPPLERTGAGDAATSTVVVALALGKPLSEALLWGPVNSMSVVQEVGAQKGLLSRAQLEKYLADAPEAYRAEPF